MRNAILAGVITLVAIGASAQVQYNYSPAGYACAASGATIRMRVAQLTYTTLTFEVTKTNSACGANGNFTSPTGGTVYIKDAQTQATIASAGYGYNVPAVNVVVTPGFTTGSRQMYAVIYSPPNTYTTQPITVTAIDVVKVGVVAFRDGQTQESLVQDVLNKVGGVAQRDGKGRRAQVAIELEVNWQLTADKNFDWYVKFAQACEAKSVKWTPQLSPHYLPDTVATKYKPDTIVTVNGGAITSTFLPISPSSAMWGTEAALWADAFVEKMAATGHIGPKAAIDEFLVGNEMGFPISALTSADSATTVKYKGLHGVAPPKTLTDSFKTFRANELSYAINAMLNAVKKRLATRNWSDAGVSSKLYSYYFPPRADSGCLTKHTDCYFGYTSTSIDYLSSQFKRIFSFDSYPSYPRCSGTWKFTDDSGAALAHAAGKPLYVAEFNAAGGCTTYSSDEVYSYGTTAINSYNVRAFMMFAYNPLDTKYKLDTPQYDGLRRVFNAITQ